MSSTKTQSQLNGVNMRKTTNESTAFKSGFHNFGGAYSSGGKSKVLMTKTAGIQSYTQYGTTRPINVSKSVNK